MRTKTLHMVADPREAPARGRVTTLCGKSVHRSSTISNLTFVTCSSCRRYRGEHPRSIEELKDVRVGDMTMAEVKLIEGQERE